MIRHLMATAEDRGEIDRETGAATDVPDVRPRMPTRAMKRRETARVLLRVQRRAMPSSAGPSCRSSLQSGAVDVACR
jgi:hypothetical protein